MRHTLNKRNDGFTIIEVMIVLAIAGLIMLIVFLAVPALQRNSRNTQRSNDASKIVAAVNECLVNKNYKINSCNSMAATELGGYIDMEDNAQLTALTRVLNATPGTGSQAPGINRAVLHLASKCNPEGTAPVPASTKSFAVLYQVETNDSPVTRCVGN